MKIHQPIDRHSLKHDDKRYYYFDFFIIIVRLSIFNLSKVRYTFDILVFLHLIKTYISTIYKTTITWEKR